MNPAGALLYRPKGGSHAPPDAVDRHSERSSGSAWLLAASPRRSGLLAPLVTARSVLGFLAPTWMRFYGVAPRRALPHDLPGWNPEEALPLTRSLARPSCLVDVLDLPLARSLRAPAHRLPAARGRPPSSAAMTVTLRGASSPPTPRCAPSSRAVRSVSFFGGWHGVGRSWSSEAHRAGGPAAPAPQGPQPPLPAGRGRGPAGPARPSSRSTATRRPACA